MHSTASTSTILTTVVCLPAPAPLQIVRQAQANPLWLVLLSSPPNGILYNSHLTVSLTDQAITLNTIHEAQSPKHHEDLYMPSQPTRSSKYFATSVLGSSFRWPCRSAARNYIARHPHLLWESVNMPTKQHNMLIAHCLVCYVLWIIYGVVQWVISIAVDNHYQFRV
jgi:hypothetical protein